MPSEDLILNVRQIGNYTQTAIAFPGDLLLLQRGGLGGPYQAISAQSLVATALAQGGGPLDVSTGYAPADAVPMQIFTDNLVVALGATHNWNCYFSSTTNSFAYTTTGPAAAFGFDGTAGFLWSAGPAGAAGAPAPLGELMQLSAIGQLVLTTGSITLPRDPMAPNEAATAGWVAANTVASFNGRTGAVTLGTWDILYAGGAPIWSPEFGGAPKAPTPEPASCDNRIATTQYVQCAIVQSIDSFLGSEVFVASFNGRTGPVVLTAADVTALGLPYAPIDSPNFTGYATSLTPPQGTSTGQIATTAFVMHAVAASVTGVASWNGRTGLVVLSPSDLTGAGGALLGSPIFTGTPQAPTPPALDNSTRLATTAFVTAATGGGNFAPLNSPAFTGVPTGPTAAVGTDTSQLATTAFVMSEINAVNAGVVSFNGRTGVVTLLANDISAAGGAPINAPTFTGAAHAPTPSAGDSSTLIATTAYVETALGSLPAGVSTFNGRAGTVILTLPDVTSVGGAPLASPTFTGSPVTTTPPPGDNSTRIADTAFVAAAFAALPAIPATPTTTPLMNGTAAIGSSGQWAEADHVHPVDTSRYSASNPSGFQTAAQVATAVAPKFDSAGGIISGGVSINGTLAANLGVLNVGIAAGGGPNVTIGLLATDNSGRGALQWNGSSNSVTLSHATSGASFSIDSAGNCHSNTSAAGIFATSPGLGFQPGGGPWMSLSDGRIKTVDGEYEAGLEELSALRPVVYAYKGNDAIDAHGASINRSAAQRGTKFVGLVAQEVEEVMPGLVTTRNGFIDGAEVDDLRVLNTGPLTYALINAVKQLAARIAALEGATR